MSNTETENLIVRIVTEMLEIVKGQEAPFNYSTIVAQLKNKFPNFPKELGMKKSAEFVDYLMNKDLVSKAYPKGETVLYIQPVKPLNTWLNSLTSYSLDESLLFADGYNIPMVKFQNWVSFIDFLDTHKNTPRFKGRILNSQMQSRSTYSFWIEKNGICYYTEAFDFPSITSIRELILFGMGYDQTQGEIIGNFGYLPNEILVSHNKLGGEFRNMMNSVQGYLSPHDDIYVPLKQNLPYQNYQTLLKNHYRNISEFLEEKKIGIYHPDLVKMYNSDAFSSLDHNDRMCAIAGGYKSEVEYNKGIEMGSLLEKEYIACTQGGFESVSEYREALQKGFEDSVLFRESKQLGYPKHDDFVAGKDGGFRDYAEYNQSIRGGFTNVDEYREAISVNISDRNQYIDWVNQRDERVNDVKPTLIELLGTLKDDLYSLERLLVYIKSEHPNITTGDLRHLLENDIEINKMGTYLDKFKGFQKGKNLMNEVIEFDNNKKQTIVIDGNNVAYENRKNKEKAKTNNLKLLMNELRSKGFDFLLFVKPTLRYNIEDEGEFNELIAQGVIKQTPGGEEDDEFILKHAIKTDSKVISNDMYRDYQKQNPKLKSKIQELRVSFSINDGVITFGPGLDDWLKKPEK